jgi:hypothetical protein
VIFLAHALPDFFDKHFRRRAIKDEETARDGRRAKARKLSRPSIGPARGGYETTFENIFHDFY